jgi:hypothetical protein
MDKDNLNKLMKNMGLKGSNNLMREINTRESPAATAAAAANEAPAAPAAAAAAAVNEAPAAAAAAAAVAPAAAAAAAVNEAPAAAAAAPAAANEAPAAAAPAPGPFDAYLISQESIAAVIDAVNATETYQVTEHAMSVLQSAGTGGIAMKRSHIFQARDYPTVYISSDIHSDYRKLVQVMKGMGLIATPIDPYDGDAIYSPELITETRWTGGNNTLLVFIGDMVDGKRDFGYGYISQPDDRLGMFEYLIYCFLYNLRIRARAQNSEIICTIGNHEAGSVLKYNKDFVDKYVSDASKKFLNSRMRVAVLSIFIKYVWPYFMISIVNGAQKEVAFVHAGFHQKGINQYRIEAIDNTNKLEETQSKIDVSNNLNTFFEVLGESGDPSIGNPLWVRTYSSDVEGFCHHITETPYPFIVVGHCVTGNQSLKRFGKLRQSRPECTDGDDRAGEIGCVFVDCHNPARGGPQLAFVDTGLSEGQRFPIEHQSSDKNGKAVIIPKLDNSTFAIEFLRLRHDPAAVAVGAVGAEAVGGAGAAAPAAPVARFYNVIERVRSDNGAITQQYVGPAAEPQAGGRRTRYRRRKTQRRRRQTRALRKQRRA